MEEDIAKSVALEPGNCKLEGQHHIAKVSRFREDITAESSAIDQLIATPLWLMRSSLTLPFAIAMNRSGQRMEAT